MAETTSLNRAELMQGLFENMSAMKRSIAVRWQSMSQDCPISHGQLELLFTIRTNEPVSFKQLAQHLRLTPGAISQLAEGLEQHEFITRQSDPKDRRIQCLQVSEKGHQFLQHIKKHREEIMEGIMAGLTDEELAFWLRIQDKLLEQLENTKSENHVKENA